LPAHISQRVEMRTKIKLHSPFERAFQNDPKTFPRTA
jgi:hypothetical protein